MGQAGVLDVLYVAGVLAVVQDAVSHRSANGTKNSSRTLQPCRHSMF